MTISANYFNSDKCLTYLCKYITRLTKDKDKEALFKVIYLKQTTLAL